MQHKKAAKQHFSTKFRRVSARTYYFNNKFALKKVYNVSYVLNWHCRCLYMSFLFAEVITDEMD